MYAIATPRCIMDYESQGFVQNFSLIGEDLKKLLSRVYLHSGRTDEYGGHHDWFNKTGWGIGSYHYHHKLSAHLHQNGKCPYGELKASIINPYTAKEINLGKPYFYEGEPYFSLNLVCKSLTAEDHFGASLGLGTGINPSFPGGSIYACPAGNSSIDDGLGEYLSFTYPKNILGFVLNNTFFKTDCGKLQLLCHNKKAEADDAICYAYVSLETIREYMMKDGYFTDFSDNGSGVWSFTVRNPSIMNIKVTSLNNNVPPFNIGDTLTVEADIDNVANAKLIIREHVEVKDNLLSQSNIKFNDYMITNEDAGILTIKVEVNTGGTAIDAETLTSTVQIQIEEPRNETDDYFAIIKRGTLSIRSTPSTAGNPLRTLAPGESIKIVSPKNTQYNDGVLWTEVYSIDNQTGWVADEFIHPNVPIITEFLEAQYNKISGHIDTNQIELEPINNWGVLGGGDYGTGEVPKDQGRYLVGVGPRIIYQGYPNDAPCENEDLSGFSRHIEVELEHKTNGSRRIIKCLIDDIKAHTYSKYPDNHIGNSLPAETALFPVENGIVQTGIRYPTAHNNWVLAGGNADGSVIEFKGGKFSDFNLKDYKLIQVISNVQRTDLFKDK